MVLGIPQLGEVRTVCEACLSGRQSRERFPKTTEHRLIRVLEFIHADLIGPLATPSLSGLKHIAVFINNYSQKSWVFFLKN